MITFELYRHQARHEQDSFAATVTRIGCAKSGRLEYGHGLPDLGRAVGRRALKATLAAHPRTLVLDEAQWLSSEQLEYIRYLWDDPYTQLAVIFVGGEGCHATLRKEPMLSSRIFIWQRFTRLTTDEVLETIPLYHPIWADADPKDITYADSRAAHGNFRNWARLTAHTLSALNRTGRPRVDQEVLRWAFSRLGSGT